MRSTTQLLEFTLPALVALGILVGCPSALKIWASCS